MNRKQRIDKILSNKLLPVIIVLTNAVSGTCELNKELTTPLIGTVISTA